MNYQDKTREELIEELVQQRKEFNSLKTLFNKEVNERKYVEFVLRERLKELTCHNQISKIFSDSALSIEMMCEEIIHVIPEAFQFPEFTKACLCIYDKVYSLPNFSKTKHFINQQIKVKDQIIGQEFALKAVTIDGQVVEIGKATVSQANILCWPWGCSGTAKGKTTLFPGMKVTDTGLQVLMAINNDPLLIKRFDLEPPPGILYLEFEYTGQ